MSMNEVACIGTENCHSWNNQYSLVFMGNNE